MDNRIESSLYPRHFRLLWDVSGPSIRLALPLDLALAYP